MSRVSVVIGATLVLLLLPLIILVKAVIAMAEARCENGLMRCMESRSEEGFGKCAVCQKAEACDEIAREEEIDQLVKAGIPVPSYMFS